MATVTDRESLLTLGKTAQRAARELSLHSTETKNQALANVADLLERESKDRFLKPTGRTILKPKRQGWTRQCLTGSC